ncbi:hypothetical protein IX308_001736 [Porphyromonas levii]|nr:hypothetical protein [Porphyromonas levii]
MPNIQLKARWSRNELPENTEQEWSDIIRTLVEIDCPLDSEGEVTPHIVPFSFEAKSRLYAWQEEHARICDTEANETLVGIYCKLEIYIIRFCLIIQLARWSCQEADKQSIDATSVERAIALTEYFRSMAQQVQVVMECNQLNQQQRQLLIELPSRFHTAEALQIGDRLGFKERAIKDFLSRNIGTLFTKERHGLYKKINV